MKRRRLFFAALMVLSAGVMSGCDGSTATTTAAQVREDAAAAPPLGTSVPHGTSLVIGDPTTEKALRFSGLINELSFEVQWANFSGGPQTTEAFRAGALDVGAVADIPPIHATWTGLDVRIIAARFRRDPIKNPTYDLGIAPGANIRAIGDLRGKRIAYSPGQAQGALVLRVLRAAGLTRADVELVELPSTGDAYSAALSGKQVDAAPIGGVQIKRYLAKYGSEGATTIAHGIRDDPGHLYVLKSTLDDPGKAAALREYVTLWARALRWVEDHPAEWIDQYYVKDQGLKADDGQYLVERAGDPDVPDDWTDVIKRHQETIDLLAAETDQKPFPAQNLYDRRFEQVGHEGYEGDDS
jgi:sulfonate transport system substrate-binding protein